jgi:hypothetical protein
MAVEVENGGYRFKHYHYDSSDDSDDSEDNEVSPLNLKTFMKKRPVAKDALRTKEALNYFYHNPIHDVESVWWGCVELLFKKRVVCEALPELEQQYKQAYKQMQTAAEQIFPDMGTSSKRSLFLTDRRFHEETMSILPSALRPIATVITNIRNTLVSRYAKLERIDDAVKRKMAHRSVVVADFVTLLLDAVSAAKGMKLTDFSDDWIKNAFPSPAPVEERDDWDQQAGVKRKCSDLPSDIPRSKRPREDSASR